MKTNEIVKTLKQENMDYEFYPTTDEIIDCIARKFNNPIVGAERGNVWNEATNKYNEVSIYKYKSILDIGAGNGATLSKLASRMNISHKKAIEKNPMLRALLDDVQIIGCDFLECNIWNKEADIFFCNPPFSQYSFWASKIIDEATYCKDIVLVLPERWKTNTDLQQTIKIKGYDVEVLGVFNFSNAERQARGAVEVIRIQVEKDADDDDVRWFRRRNNDKNDYVKNMLAKEFSDLIKLNNESWKTQDDKKAVKQKELDEKLENAVVAGSDYPTALYNIYLQEKDNILNLANALKKIDAELLVELKIDYRNVEELILSKLSQLEKKYWGEIVEKMEVISDKLISKERRHLEAFIWESGLDFTPSNIYHVVTCCIKIVNSCLDNQILAVYDELVRGCDVYKYKSNEKIFIKNDWENKNKPIGHTHYKLTYRMVKEGFSYKFTDYNRDYYSRDGCNHVRTFIDDLGIIASNMGYNIQEEARGDVGSHSIGWYEGEKYVPLVEYKVYKNGNVHLKFNKKFIDKLNVIKGKLEGWLHGKDDVMQEFDVTQDEAINLLALPNKVAIGALQLGYSA